MKKYLLYATLAPTNTPASATDSLIGVTSPRLAQPGRLNYTA